MEKNQSFITKNFYILGTVISLSVYSENAIEAIFEAISRLTEIDDKMSVFKPESEISKINAGSGVSPVRVSPDTYRVIKTALYYSYLSGGAFNPLIRPLVDLWGIGTRSPKVPVENDIKTVLSQISFKDIILADETISVGLRHKGQSLDLGAIAKGYAADEVKRIFSDHAVKSAMIDLGGNIFAYGKKPDDTLWKVGIQDPCRLTGNYLGFLQVEDKSIVTSGNYERNFQFDEKVFHHILDPKTGYPSENGIISTTIVSDNSIDGDALSTCTYVMGIEKGLGLIESIDGVEAIIITSDKKVHSTSGIKNFFQILNKDYSFSN